MFIKQYDMFLLGDSSIESGLCCTSSRRAHSLETFVDINTVDHEFCDAHNVKSDGWYGSS